MSGWQEFYDSGVFSINTTEPSSLVSEFAEEIPANSRVADIGCGAGRNAIFLASRGAQVEASDIVDLDWRPKLPKPIRDRIEFQIAPAAELTLEPDSYQAILMMRLLQYLSPEEIEVLTIKVAQSLKVGGIALASFVTGNISQTVKDAVAVYTHSAGYIQRGFELAGMTTVIRRHYHTADTHVPFPSEVDACELVIRK